MKTLLTTTIVLATVAAATILPLTVKANTWPVESDCTIHNNTQKTVDYHSVKASGIVAAQGEAKLKWYAVNPSIGMPIDLHWSGGHCTVKYEKDGSYASTDPGVICLVHRDDVSAEPTS